MKKKFVFAKPGKKRFVSQCEKTPTTGLFGFQQKFGAKTKLANAAEAAKKEEEKKAQKKKKKNRILGTADYMAPEVIKGEDVNYLLDFWSLGIIGYEFVTGNLPFNDDSPEQIFHNVMNKEIDWPEPGDGDFQVNPIILDFL